MSNKSDNEALLLRSRDPQHVTATGDIYAEETRGLVTAMQLNAAAGVDATAVIKEGGSGGTQVWAISALGGQSQHDPFPSGLLFEDGLHLTLTGAGASLDVAGTFEANPS